MSESSPSPSSIAETVVETVIEKVVDTVIGTVNSAIFDTPETVYKQLLDDVMIEYTHNSTKLHILRPDGTYRHSSTLEVLEILDFAVRLTESCIDNEDYEKAISQLDLYIDHPDCIGLTIGEIVLSISELNLDRLHILLKYISFEPRKINLYFTEDPRTETLVNMYGFTPKMIGKSLHISISEKIKHVIRSRVTS